MRQVKFDLGVGVGVGERREARGKKSGHQEIQLVSRG